MDPELLKFRGHIIISPPFTQHGANKHWLHWRQQSSINPCRAHQAHPEHLWPLYSVESILVCLVLGAINDRTQTEVGIIITVWPEASYFSSRNCFVTHRIELPCQIELRQRWDAGVTHPPCTYTLHMAANKSTLMTIFFLNFHPQKMSPGGVGTLCHLAVLHIFTVVPFAYWELNRWEKIQFGGAVRCQQESRLLV